MTELIVRNSNVRIRVTQPSTTETVYVLQGAEGPQGPAGGVLSVVAGSNVTVDSTDPANPVVSAATPDHGALTGLADDDHPQYHTDARGDTRYYTKAQVDTSLAGKSDTSHGHDHGALAGLGDDDHPQYAKKAGDTFTAASAASIPLAIVSAPAQTANLTEWRNSAGAIVTAIVPSGRLQVNGAAAVQFTGELGGSFTPSGASGNSIILIIDGVQYKLPIYPV